MIYFKFQVTELLKAKDDAILILKQENERLRQEIGLESRRANNAVDRLLNQANVNSITPDAKRSVNEKADDIIKNIRAAVRIGQDVEGDKSAGN